MQSTIRTLSQGVSQADLNESAQALDKHKKERLSHLTELVEGKCDKEELEKLAKKVESLEKQLLNGRR